MWKLEDHKGEEKTWYSEEEYSTLRDNLVLYKELLYKLYKISGSSTVDLEHYYYGMLRAEGLLDEFYERREKEQNGMQTV